MITISQLERKKEKKGAERVKRSINGQGE